MDEAKRKRLEQKGWKVGTVAEFLGLTPEEGTLIKIKLNIEGEQGEQPYPTRRRA